MSCQAVLWAISSFSIIGYDAAIKGRGDRGGGNKITSGKSKNGLNHYHITGCIVESEVERSDRVAAVQRDNRHCWGLGVCRTERREL